MKTKAIIFDLDGTLVDSIKDISSAMNTVLRDMKLPEHDKDKYYYFAGLGIKNLVIESLPEDYRDTENIEHAYLEMMKIYSANLVVDSTLYDGISELLDELSKLDIILTVFSNKAHELTQEVAKKLLNKWDFNIILGTGPTPNKPNPEGVKTILDSLKLETEEAIFVGDTNIDMKTAQNSKLKAIGVLWGFRDKEELVSAGAYACITNPLDLLNHIK